MPEIGIVEARNIIRVIRQKYDFDFSQYALPAFRFGLDRVILRHHLRYPELLVSRILEDEEFFDDLLYDLNDSGAELFRDPETWIELKTEILPKLFETSEKPSIWLPGVCSIQDIYSLLILLTIEFPNKECKVIVSTFSEKMRGIILKGEIAGKLVESGNENFEKIFSKGEIRNFLVQSEKDFLLPSKIFEQVSFVKQNLNFEPQPENIELILFRNMLLNYSPDLQKDVLEKLCVPLVKRGIFITGIKENIDDILLKQNTLKKVNINEKVYIKVN